MKITAAMLVQAGACHYQVVLFRQTFPRGAVVNSKNYDKAKAVGLNVQWFLEAFAAPHRDAYEAARKTHRDAYEAARKPHWDAYRAAIKPHWDAYEAAIKPHRDAYRAAIKPHRDAYEAAIKDAFLAAFKE